MSQLTSALAANMGAVQKALLIIHKDDPEEINTAKVSETTQSVLSMASTDMSARRISAGLQTAGLDVCVMQVQYNPSSLSIQANAKPIPFTYLQQHVDSGIPNQNLRPPMVLLSVELIFDAMNPQDAFMMDKVRLSAGTMASNAAGIVKNVKDGGYTVQPQTEGLLAALLRSNTRVAKV